MRRCVYLLVCICICEYVPLEYPDQTEKNLRARQVITLLNLDPGSSHIDCVHTEPKMGRLRNGLQYTSKMILDLETNLDEQHWVKTLKFAIR